jgi:hypothetical protein
MVKSDEAALYEGGEKSIPLNCSPFPYAQTKNTMSNRLSGTARRGYFLDLYL